MDRIFHYQVTEAEEGISVRDYLRGRGYSRHILAHIKRTEGGICRNGKTVPVTVSLHAGDCLDIRLEEVSASEHILPAPVPFSVVFEDEDLLVVNKPADTPIHPSFQNRENTLANGVLHYYEQQGMPFVFRCINRLDRDTSGLLIIAKNMLSSSILSTIMKQRTLTQEEMCGCTSEHFADTACTSLQDRKIRRTYLAIAEGQICQGGSIAAPIGRKEGSVLERCVDFDHGEYAVTHYQPLLYREDLNLTLVSLELETGRTHQIRVHMGYLGHPLIGDYLYYPRRDLINRQALHSWKLEFSHPITQKRLSFQAPLPEDMQFILPPMPSPAINKT